MVRQTLGANHCDRYRDHCSGVLQWETELNSVLNKDKWGFIAMEQG